MIKARIVYVVLLAAAFMLSIVYGIYQAALVFMIFHIAHKTPGRDLTAGLADICPIDPEKVELSLGRLSL